MPTREPQEMGAGEAALPCSGVLFQRPRPATGTTDEM